MKKEENTEVVENLSGTTGAVEDVVRTENTEVVENLSEEKPFVLVFQGPYVFEGKEYKEIDLSGMQNLTVQDITRIEKRRSAANGYQSFNLNPEYSVDYACYFAAEASDLPIEFFFGLPAPEGIALRKIVSNFLLW